MRFYDFPQNTDDFKGSGTNGTNFVGENNEIIPIYLHQDRLSPLSPLMKWSESLTHPLHLIKLGPRNGSYKAANVLSERKN